LDEGESWRVSTGRPRGKPVEDLRELQLIVQVVLEPECHFLVRCGGAQATVAGFQLAGDVHSRSAVRCEETRAQRPQRIERCRRRDRPFVEHVPPGQDLPFDTG
jgi:hypothetical protein